MGHLIHGRKGNEVAAKFAADTSSAGNIDPRGIASYKNLPAFGLLQHAAEQIPDHPAAVYDEQTWTFDDLNSASIRAAAMLQRMGVRPGDRVGVLLPNVPEFMITANAIW
ncbi:MAG: AMP-binding protein, partial [Rubripirellula sp.]